MKKKMTATVIGQSIIHIHSHTIKNEMETRKIHGHLIGELKLKTDENRIVYVRCPIKDGCIVIENDGTPDHKMGMQLYNTIVCKHPFGSRRVITHMVDEKQNRRHIYTLTSENAEAFNQQLARQLHKLKKGQNKTEAVEIVQEMCETQENVETEAQA